MADTNYRFHDDSGMTDSFNREFNVPNHDFLINRLPVDENDDFFEDDF